LSTRDLLLKSQREKFALPGLTVTKTETIIGTPFHHYLESLVVDRVELKKLPTSNTLVTHQIVSVDAETMQVLQRITSPARDIQVLSMSTGGEMVEIAPTDSRDDASVIALESPRQPPTAAQESMTDPFPPVVDGESQCDDVYPDLNALIDTLIDRPDCPVIIRDILENARSLRGPSALQSRTQSEDEVVDAFKQLDSESFGTGDFTQPFSTDLTGTLEKESAQIEGPSPEEDDVPDELALDDILGVPNKNSVARTRSPKLIVKPVAERPMSPSMKTLRMTFTAILALRRFQKKLRQRYQAQRDALINDLGL